jgi:hypothetical protein
VPEIRFHDLRHLAGTLTALAGGTIKEIQARLGHASPDAAMVYQHVAQGRDGVLAAEIDRIIWGEAARAGWPPPGRRHRRPRRATSVQLAEEDRGV